MRVNPRWCYKEPSIEVGGKRHSCSERFYHSQRPPGMPLFVCVSSLPSHIIRREWHHSLGLICASPWRCAWRCADGDAHMCGAVCGYRAVCGYLNICNACTYRE